MDSSLRVLEALGSPDGRRGDGFDCFREGAAYRLNLWGALPPAWAGNLALHCFASGLEIVTGDARRNRGSFWVATFLLQATEPSTPVRGRDFLQMARRAPRAVPSLPEPQVEIDIRRSERTQSVYAHVHGRDSIGLLGEVLRRFGKLGLQPRQFTLHTHDAEVRDWFWLEPADATGGARHRGELADLPEGIGGRSLDPL